MLIIKEPTETWREQLVFGGVATITSVVAVASASSGLVPGSAAITVTYDLFASAMMLQIDGGTDGERYTVTIDVIDADAQPRQLVLDVAVLVQGWLMPDGSRPMLSIAEFITRFTFDEVVRMTDAKGNGTVDKEALVGALTDAQAQVEANAGERYALPLEPIPSIIKLVIADLARGRFYPGQMPDGIAGAMKAAQRTLERIQSGQLSLPGVAPASADVAGGGDSPSFRSGGRAYADGLKDY